MYYWKALEQKEDASKLVASLPKASLHPVYLEDYSQVEIDNPSGYQASVVSNQIIGVVTKKYQLVQHEEAFMPIVEALDSTGEQYSISVWSRKGKAGMRIVTGLESADGVKLGFQAINSVDGTTSLYYTLTSFIRKSVVEIVGYRKVCSNGMIARVPLDQAEFVKPELKIKILELLKKTLRIVHVGDAKAKAESVRYIVEAMSLLKEPVALMIGKAQHIEIGREEAMKLLEKYVSERLAKQCYRQFLYDKDKEGSSLWGLYNAITYKASHNGLSESSQKSLLESSAEMLKDVLVDGVEATIKED